jgi:simple sugar transport system substrate-binding protein
LSETDNVHEGIERLEWDERKEEDSPIKRWRQFTRRSALTGGAAGIAAMILEACGGSSKSSSTGTASAASGSSAASIFGASGSYKFTMVNHVTTNPFFAPTQTGASDACKLLGCSYQWTGSQTSNISEMVNAFNTAVSAGVQGIGVALISTTAFNSGISKALSAGIPVLAYNADAPNSGRLAYIGQDLYLSGQELGKHIAALVPSGDVAMFIATPGTANIQPRINGALATLKSTPAITTHVIATGAATPQELTTIQAYAKGHPNTKGMFAVDAGSTQAVAQTIQQQGLKGKVKGGGYDTLGPTVTLLNDGYIQVTIDQQPYLQGFFPILQMYLYKASNTLSGIADVNTGLKFITSANVKPYVSNPNSKFEK